MKNEEHKPDFGFRYEVSRELGAGAQGAVYLVEDRLQGGERMALKVLAGREKSQPLQWLELFRREFEALAGLSHPRLARVYDFGSTRDGEIFFTRDYVQGSDLMEATAGASLDDFIGIGVEVCRALAPLHRASLVHGDIKPGNTIIGEDGIARLIDFSFVGASGNDAAGRGTCLYMAPEVIEEKSVDVRSDIYSLGVSFFEVLSGAPVFEGSVREVLSGHLGSSRPVLELGRISGGSEKILAQAAELKAIVERMIAPRPEDRFPDVEEVEAAFTALAPDLVGPDPVPAAPVRHGAWIREDEVAGLFGQVEARLNSPEERPILHAVVGGPGTGKSAVLRAVKWTAQLKGVTALEVHCEPGGGMLGPVAALARLAAERISGSPGEEARAVRLIEILDNPVTSGTDFEELAAGTSDLISWAAARGPLLILLEDVDNGSGEALEILGSALARTGPGVPVAVVGTVRSEFDWRARLGEGTSTILPNLDLDGVRRAVEHYFGGADEEAVARVLEHTGGNPLFVSTLLEDLFAAGEGLERLDSLGPPMALETYWIERLEMLEDADREILEACAVCQAPVTIERLCGVCERERGDVESAVESLGSGGWLVRTGVGWSAKTVPMARAVLAGIPEEKLALLHGRAMDKERDEARLMAHAAACGDREVLEGRGERVAQALERMGALELAADLYEGLQRVVGGDRYTVARGRVATARGDHGTALDLLGPLAERGEGSIRAEALLLIGEINTVTRNYAKACESLEAALELAGTEVARAGILCKLANAHFRKGEIDRGRDRADEGLSLAPEGSSVRAELSGILGMMAVSEKDHDRAIELCCEGVEDARSSGVRRTLALAIDRLAWVYQQAGRIDSAIGNLTEVVGLNREIGDMRRLMRALQALGDLHWWKEDWSASLARYEEASRLVGLVGSRAQVIEVRIGLGWALNNVGRFERAALVLEEAREEATSLGLEELRLRALVFEGDNRAWQGRVDEALARWSEALEGMGALGREGICAEVELEMAETLLWRRGDGDVEAAGKLVESSGTREREELGRRFEDLAELVEGILSLSRGEYERGVSTLDALIGRLEERGAKDLLWQAQLAVAREMVERGSDVLARKRLRIAEGILSKLAAGLPPEHRLAFWQDVRRSEVRRLLAVTVPSSRVGNEISPGAARGGEEAQGEVDALYRVLDFNKRLATETDLDRLMEAILDSAIELTGAERGFVLTPSDGGLVVKAAREIGTGAARDPHEQFSRSIAESVFLDGEPVVTVDASGDDRFSEFVSIHELKVRSVACVPVSFRGNGLGVLYLENRLRRGRFGGRDLRVLSAFSDQVAIAVTQAGMLDDAREREEELSRTTAALEQLCARQAEDLKTRKTDLKLVEQRFERIKQRVEGQGDFHGVVGSGPRMKRVFEMMERVADLDIPVVFVGESGTGKDLLARVLHDIGERRLGPFVPVSCGGVPESLVEATLFGHTPGAFSGADKERLGLLASSTGGTLYLDDIGEMPARMQVDLLRVLQEGCFTPLGGNSSIRTDFRLLASSREDPRSLVERGLLRQDLFYRLQVLSLELPLLRERREDLPYLARRIIVREANKLGREPRPLSADALDAIDAHPWEGNVRELEQLIRRALVVSDEGPEITADALFGKVDAPVRKGSAARPARTAPVDAEEEARIMEALEACQWNRSRAAKMLGIPRRTFYRRLDRMGLTKKR